MFNETQQHPEQQSTANKSIQADIKTNKQIIQAKCAAHHFASKILQIRSVCVLNRQIHAGRFITQRQELSYVRVVN